MIEGLVQILLWQGIGEMVSKFLIPSLPGPVIGLILLVIFLSIKGEVNPSLAMVADAFRQHLALLFVPASVGVILFLPELQANALAIGTALTVSVILAITITAMVLKLFSFKEPVYENTKTYKQEMKVLDDDRRQQTERQKHEGQGKDRRQQDSQNVGNENDQ